MEQIPLQGMCPQETSVSGGGVSMQQVAKLAVFLTSDEAWELNGRLVSATTEDFPFQEERIRQIMASDAFPIRRVELG